MPGPYSGTQGYVRIGGVSKTASKWTADLKQVVVDRSNYTTAGEPLNAYGQRTSDITVSGPYEGPLQVVRGSLVDVVLGISADLFITVRMRVGGVQFTKDKDGGPEFTLTGNQYGPASVDHL